MKITQEEKELLAENVELAVELLQRKVRAVKKANHLAGKLSIVILSLEDIITWMGTLNEQELEILREEVDIDLTIKALEYAKSEFELIKMPTDTKVQ